jgi:hypothetical protein
MSSDDAAHQPGLANGKVGSSPELPSATVRPKRWWWPPDRKKAKIMTAIMNMEQFRVNTAARIEQAWLQRVMYGHPLPTQAEWDGMEAMRRANDMLKSELASPTPQKEEQ